MYNDVVLPLWCKWEVSPVFSKYVVIGKRWGFFHSNKQVLCRSPC